MPRIGVSITKSTTFRGGVQEFSNVYYYEATGLPSVAQADTIIDNITAMEKTFHSTAVTFVRGRLWEHGGSPSTNNMISQKNLSGIGARALAANMDKERAFLLRLRAGVDSRGNPVYLRKWFHACGVFYSGQTVSQNVLENAAGFSGTEKTNIVGVVGGIGDGNGSPLTLRLCSKAGRLPNAGANWESHNYLEHHQLGDMWRAQ